MKIARSCWAALFSFAAAGCSGGGSGGGEETAQAPAIEPAQSYGAAGRESPAPNAAPGAAAPGPAAMAAVNPRGLPDGAFHVKRVEIIDRNGFEKPMTAMTIMVPADWTGQGGVVWGANTGCGSGSGYTVDYAASSPDGRSGLHIFPSFTWAWNNFMGGDPSGACPFLQITSVEQYLNYLVSQTRPGARVLDFRPRPDIAESYKQLNSVTPMAGGEMRSWIDAGEVLISSNQNGMDLRETLAAVVYFSRTYTRGTMGMQDSDIISGSAMPGFAMRAPNGELDFNFAELVRKSIRAEPEWSQRIGRHNAKIAQTNIQGARERSKIIAQTGEEIREMRADSWRKQNESFNYTSREDSEAIRGVETYNDPYYGGTVELDHTYENAWQLNDGSYVLTNDTMFEPFRDLGVDGQRLEAAQ